MTLEDRCRVFNAVWWTIYGAKDMSAKKEKPVMRKRWCEKFGYVAEDFDCEGCRKCEG